MDKIDFTKGKKQMWQYLETVCSHSEFTQRLYGKLVQISPETWTSISVTAVTLISLWLVLKSWSGDSSSGSKHKKKRRPKKKKLSKVQEATLAIDEILNNIALNLVPKFEIFETDLENGKFSGTNYKKQTMEDPEYQIRYFNEILLNQLELLDQVESHGNEQLRLKRKNAIKYIQNYHKSLDALKDKL